MARTRFPPITPPALDRQGLSPSGCFSLDAKANDERNDVAESCRRRHLCPTGARTRRDRRVVVVVADVVVPWP